MNSVFSLDHAFMRFFRKQAKFPRYKSRKNGRYSYTTNCINQNVVVEEHYIKLPKLGKVKAKIHRTVLEDWKLKSATISCDSTGAYYCSILYKYEAEIQRVTAKEENVIGLDYKTSCLYADSNGNTAEMPKYYKKSHGRLARAQRKLRNKTKGSRNYRKQMKKCNKIQKHIADQRKDFLHKKAAEITNQYDLVCIEDLSIREQLKGRKYRNYRKSTLDNGWYAFTRMLDYKLKDRGKQLIKVNKAFPSTKLCHCCSCINDTLNTDKIRKWVCPKCFAEHDRDINAAINIKKEGWRLYKGSAVTV